MKTLIVTVLCLLASACSLQLEGSAPTPAPAPAPAPIAPCYHGAARAYVANEPECEPTEAPVCGFSADDRPASLESTELAYYCVCQADTRHYYCFYL